MQMQIILSNGMECLVSEADYALLARWKWTASKSQQKWQARPNWYAARWEKRKIYMHRQLLEAPTGLVVDHINGNTLDNRRENLRLCTHKENFEYSCAGVDRSGEWS